MRRLRLLRDTGAFLRRLQRTMRRNGTWEYDRDTGEWIFDRSAGQSPQYAKPNSISSERLSSELRRLRHDNHISQEFYEAIGALIDKHRYD